MNERYRQDIARAFHILGTVDKGSHRFTRRRQHLDHMAIKYCLGRDDFSAQCFQNKVNNRAPCFDKIGMGEFLERDNDISVFHAQIGQMAMRIKTGTNHHIRPDHSANARNQIAFTIKVILCDHCAMQAKDNTVNRHGGPQLAKDLIAKLLICFAVDQPAGLSPGGSSFDQVPAFFGGTKAPFGKDGTAQGRGNRMLPRRCIKAFLKIGKIST